MKNFLKTIVAFCSMVLSHLAVCLAHNAVVIVNRIRNACTPNRTRYLASRSLRIERSLACFMKLQGIDTITNEFLFAIVGNRWATRFCWNPTMVAHHYMYSAPKTINDLYTMLVNFDRSNPAALERHFGRDWPHSVGDLYATQGENLDLMSLLHQATASVVAGQPPLPDDEHRARREEYQISAGLLAA